MLSSVTLNFFYYCANNLIQGSFVSVSNVNGQYCQGKVKYCQEKVKHCQEKYKYCHIYVRLCVHGSMSVVCFPLSRVLPLSQLIAQLDDLCYSYLCFCVNNKETQHSDVLPLSIPIAPYVRLGLHHGHYWIVRDGFGGLVTRGLHQNFIPAFKSTKARGKKPESKGQYSQLQKRQYHSHFHIYIAIFKSNHLQPNLI